MKHAATIVGMLLLALSVSCRKADTNGQSAGNADVNTKATPETAPAETRPVDPLDECQTLIEAARKVSSSDTQAAMAAWDKVAECLHDCMYTSDQAMWLTMKAEVEKARTKIAKTQEDMELDKIKKLLVNGEYKAGGDALDVFIKKYPEHVYAKRLKEGVKQRQAIFLLRKEAFDLYDQKRWAEALGKLKRLSATSFTNREIRTKRYFCLYKLEMVKFEAAIKAGDYKAAEAAGEKAAVFNPDAWDTEIAPKLAAMKARQ